MKLRELQNADQKEITTIAILHKKAFPSFFLTQLGIPFLKTLYAGYAEDEESGIIIAEENGKTLGFLAYSKNYSRFFKELMRHHLVKFAICSAGAAVKHPNFIKRLLGAFKKSNEVAKSEKYVELSSICVDPNTEGNGIGSALIEHLKQIVDFEEYRYINLETDAENNEGANRFYLKNGFSLERQFVTAEGRRMNEYRFSMKGY